MLYHLCAAKVAGVHTYRNLTERCTSNLAVVSPIRFVENAQTALRANIATAVAWACRSSRSGCPMSAEVKTEMLAALPELRRTDERQP
jgi:hypothetical protein